MKVSNASLRRPRIDWGLRDYGTAEWEGGDAECGHASAKIKTRYDYALDTSPIQDGSRTGTDGGQWRDTCPDCGAAKVDNQLGLEPTPELYVEHMVDVFREVRRVLRADGTLWLNLGDSYAAGKTGRDDSGDNGRFGGPRISPKQRTAPAGLKPKDLVGIPWRVAFALQADGWWLRSDIIWAKPNPMPESVTDRPTKAHEYIFLLTKSARYYYDADAIREPNSYTDPRGPARIGYAGRGADASRNDGDADRFGQRENGRNKRDVWTITTKPFPGAHFAVFPPELPTLCIKAGTSEQGCCSECGAPWERRTLRTPMEIDRSDRTHPLGRTRSSGTMTKPPTSQTIGWQPSCACTAKRVPCLVLDPFAGAGTTGVVSSKLGRDFIGIELNPEYAEMARKRVHDAPLSLFLPVARDGDGA